MGASSATASDSCHDRGHRRGTRWLSTITCGRDRPRLPHPARRRGAGRARDGAGVPGRPDLHDAVRPARDVPRVRRPRRPHVLAQPDPVPPAAPPGRAAAASVGRVVHDDRRRRRAGQQQRLGARHDQHRRRSSSTATRRPRWLHQQRRYLGDHPTRSAALALKLLGPWLRRWDLRAAHTASDYVTISSVVQDRVHSGYGLPSTVLPAPRPDTDTCPSEPMPQVEQWLDGE